MSKSTKQECDAAGAEYDKVRGAADAEYEKVCDAE